MVPPPFKSTVDHSVLATNSLEQRVAEGGQKENGSAAKPIRKYPAARYHFLGFVWLFFFFFRSLAATAFFFSLGTTMTQHQRSPGKQPLIKRRGREGFSAAHHLSGPLFGDRKRNKIESWLQRQKKRDRKLRQSMTLRAFAVNIMSRFRAII